ncbi:MAG: NADPH:quinone oxidoreductase family protein [Gammaproteobacteria bacterium AqS3]|nr:NADPH:quinone oxidoreductase family protein [Gammaproteobacteria bacterium AqS3]
MRALWCSALSDDLSGVEVVSDAPEPQPGADELLIKIEAAAANFPDLLMTRGEYQFKPPLPFAPGMEGSGTVLSAPAGSRFSEGDAVVFGARFGAMAERIAVPEAAAAPRPAGMDAVQAAGYRVAFHTAYVGLCVRTQLRAGEVLLVHGATGGVGMAAVDVGVHLGARVIATGSNAEKLEVVRARGAEVIACPDRVDFRERVLELTDSRGADVIYDAVGGDWFDQSARCIAWAGRLLVIGFAGGRIPQIAANIPLIKGFSVIGVRAGEHGRRVPEVAEATARTVQEWAEAGWARVHVCGELPLEQAREALRMLAARKVVGKVVVRP